MLVRRRRDHLNGTGDVRIPLLHVQFESTQPSSHVRIILLQSDQSICSIVVTFLQTQISFFLVLGVQSIDIIPRKGGTVRWRVHHSAVWFRFTVLFTFNFGRRNWIDHLVFVLWILRWTIRITRFDQLKRFWFLLFVPFFRPTAATCLRRRALRRGGILSFRRCGEARRTLKMNRMKFQTWIT